MADEGCGFYVGIFTVVGGLIFIVSMGVWSIYNPFKGKNMKSIFKRIQLNYSI